MSEDKSNTISNKTLGDRVRFYEDTFKRKEAETNDVEQRALQTRLDALKEIKAFVTVQIYVGDRFKVLDTVGLKELVLHLDSEIFKIEKEGTLDKQLLVEDAVANLSMADMNNIRFHPDKVKSGEIDFSVTREEKTRWPVGRMYETFINSTAPVGEDGRLPGPKELTQTVIIEPQKRTDEAPEHAWAKRGG